MTGLVSGRGLLSGSGLLSGRGMLNGRGMLDLGRQCWAYNFDGIDDRGQLTFRAINIEGDNSLEFFSPNALNGVVRVIIAQNVTGTAEFILQVSTSNILQLNFGNAFTNLLTIAQGFKPSTRYGLTLIGTEAKVYEGGLAGTLVNTTAFVRGAVREPTAPTIIGARQSGAGNFVNFFSGLQYDIKINGTLWEMGNRAQAVQPSLPAGNNMTLFNTTSDRWQAVPCRVYADPLTPFFTQQPSSQSVTVGATPTFTADALVDQGTVTYQWQLNTGGGFADIVGATLKTLTLLPVVIGQNGNQFRVVATANARPIFSIAATLTVTL
jgi:hypothetical protein